MKMPGAAVLFLLVAAVVVRAASMTIDSLSGPVTQNEINSFKSYMATQIPPPTPWGAFNGTNGDHNEWADGAGGNNLEAMGLMYEISGDITILTNMIGWADYCTSQRNDLMSAANGGQRVMWTGNIDKVWVPNETNSTSAGYAGGENGDTKAHLAYCALLILQNPSIWNLTVPDGDPYGYGVTYFQRATNYVAKCDEGNIEYDLKYFLTSNNLIRNPSNWPSGYHTMEANNIQMMLDGSWERLAQCHEILGDNPALLARYDAAVNGSANECLSGMENSYLANGITVYKWYYYPPTAPQAAGDNPIENVGHAAYDMVGMFREFNRGLNGEVNPYGFPRAGMIPFGNSLIYVMNVATNTFSGNVDGSGTTQNYMQAQWLLLGDWNPVAYNVIATADFASGRYASTTLMDATILWMKNRRYLEFSVSATPAAQAVNASAGTSFTVPVAPLGGFTNVVNLTVSGLPANSSAAFSSPAVNLAAINSVTTNTTLSISTSNSTPTGTYTLKIIGTSGSVSHTNTVNLTVGNFGISASPASQTVFTGASNVNYTVTLATNTGFTGVVNFGVSGLPANTSASFNPSSLDNAGSATLAVTTSNNTPVGNYALTIAGTNGNSVASTTVGLVIQNGASGILIWNGGSATDNNWGDADNWGGSSIVPNDVLIFGGTARLNNTNDTTAGTIYSNIVFNAGAGAFTLNGNPITLVSGVTNNSSAAQTVGVGINFANTISFNDGGSGIVLAGGLTNTFSGTGGVPMMLSGTGTIKNLLNSSSGGTNMIAMNNASANWTLADNDASTPITVPWILALTNGTFNFGDANNAPTLTLSGTQGAPLDNQLGMVGGGTAMFNMNNGTLTTSVRINTATMANATGIINQTGGTLNIGNQFQGANGGGAGEISIVNVSGGTMNINGGGGVFYVASRGTGTLTVSGTGAVNCGKLDISRNAAGNTVSSAGTVNLDGGTLSVTSVTNISANFQTGGSPTATFNFNGGTLVAKSGAASIFFQGSTTTPVTPIQTFVKSGGAIIDDGGNAINVGEPLQHDATLGSNPDGGLTKLDTGTLTLTATSTYTGDTIVNAGALMLSGIGSINSSANIIVAAGATLDASERSDDTLAVDNGQTLSSNGTVKGNVIVGNGATLALGNYIGLLTFNNNLTLNGGSTTKMELDKTLATNDVIQVAGTLTYGGTLMLTNLSGTLANGDSFKLFNAAGCSGVFTNITPAIPAVNLVWDTNNLSSGILSIVSSPTPPPHFASIVANGNNFVFSGTSGVPNWPYYVLASTNVSLPLVDWTTIATNEFDGNGHFSFTNPVDTNNLQQFYLLRLQ